MSLNLLREMREALTEYRSALAALNEFGPEASGGSLNAHKASAAANAVSQRHKVRNKTTVLAHQMAAKAHDQAYLHAKKSGREHVAASHADMRDYHTYHAHGPKPGMNPKNKKDKGPANISAATKESVDSPKLNAREVAERWSKHADKVDKLHGFESRQAVDAHKSAAEAHLLAAHYCAVNSSNPANHAHHTQMAMHHSSQSQV